jgi:hypothetical protein
MESAETTPNGPAETANPIPKTPILEEVTPVQNPIKKYSQRNPWKNHKKDSNTKYFKRRRNNLF